MSNFVDLRSDTVTKPTPKMREAMMKAEVGDDCYGEDPTVNALEELAAQKLGKEAAMYVPTGTMGNTAAIMTHIQSGEMVIMDSECHIYYYEMANVSSLAGAMPLLASAGEGCLDPDKVESYLLNTRHRPKTSLICMENTHNRAGGRVVPLENMESIYNIAQKFEVPIHLDGARVFNAATTIGVDVKEISKYTDSVMFCLSKGLSAPVGSVLTGTSKFIQKARIARNRLGGAMRQAGVIAAAGIVALQKMVDRLQEDHDNARTLAKGLAELDGIDIDIEKVDTNMIMIDTRPLGMKAEELAGELNKRGVKISIYGLHTIRLVTNKDVSRSDISLTIEAFRDLVNNLT
ncbi:aminotransferase class I/II-fold pyridoxal phosphate-dependent enzyme [Candidatus Poribacteria bacterium]|nr:aminotransferase class I/II-fold pyridoxal phosphate-dependent enzyme [Candidatus Poribacteria bacterium]